MIERRPAPWAWALAVAVPLVALYLLVAPDSGDLAAATYRSDLISKAGFVLWDNGWYGGHNLPGYSLISPGLGALLGLRAQLALSALAAAVLFAMLVSRIFPPPAALAASIWFACGFCLELFSGRVAYDLGFAVGLGAMLARLSGRTAAALFLAVLTSLASPVAGAFLALIELAHALGARRSQTVRVSLAMCALALAPIILLSLAFPEGGYEPFAAGAFWPQLVAVLAIGAGLSFVGGQVARMLRIGVILYALALGASYAIHTPVGGNSARLGSLLAGPLLAGLLWERHRVVLALAAPALLYWQLAPSAHDLGAVDGAPSVNASYYAPLRAELHRLDGSSPTRIEVPLMDSHWESVYLPGDGLALARGWERQLDTRYGGLFYGGSLARKEYRRWLDENGVRYVALPDAPFDSAGVQEAALIRSRPAFLRAVWSSAHWRLYEVSGSPGLAQSPGRLLALGIDSFTLQAPTPGSYRVLVRFSPYWALTSGSGCVHQAPGGWTEVQAARHGRIRVAIEFSLERVFDHGTRCS